MNGIQLLYRGAVFGLAAVAALLTPAARAAEPSPLLGLEGTPAYRQNMRQGVRDWLETAERVRRVLLIHRCSAFDKQFPLSGPPAAFALVSRLQPWVSGEDMAGVPPNELRRAAREMAVLVVRQAFSEEERSAWLRFADSPEGRRGLAVASMRYALDGLDDHLEDINTGGPLAWPLGRLRRAADEMQLRAALDAAFDDTVKDGARLLATVREEPGSPAVDAAFVKAVSKAAESGALIKAFEQRLGAADRAAYAQLRATPVFARWPDVVMKIGGFWWNASHSLVKPPQPLQPIEAFCKEAGLGGCEPGGPLNTALQSQRERWLRANAEGEVDREISKLVRAAPEAACP